MEIKSCFIVVLCSQQWSGLFQHQDLKINLRCKGDTTKVGVEFTGVRIWDDTLCGF